MSRAVIRDKSVQHLQTFPCSIHTLTLIDTLSLTSPEHLTPLQHVPHAALRWITVWDACPKIPISSGLSLMMPLIQKRSFEIFCNQTSGLICEWFWVQRWLFSVEFACSHPVSVLIRSRCSSFLPQSKDTLRGTWDDTCPGCYPPSSDVSWDWLQPCELMQ